MPRQVRHVPAMTSRWHLANASGSLATNRRVIRVISVPEAGLEPACDGFVTTSPPESCGSCPRLWSSVWAIWGCLSASRTRSQPTISTAQGSCQGWLIDWRYLIKVRVIRTPGSGRCSVPLTLARLGGLLMSGRLTRPVGRPGGRGSHSGRPGAALRPGRRTRGTVGHARDRNGGSQPRHDQALELPSWGPMWLAAGHPAGGLRRGCGGRAISWAGLDPFPGATPETAAAGRGLELGVDGGVPGEVVEAPVPVDERTAVPARAEVRHRPRVDAPSITHRSSRVGSQRGGLLSGHDHQIPRHESRPLPASYRAPTLRQPAPGAAARAPPAPTVT